MLSFLSVYSCFYFRPRKPKKRTTELTDKPPPEGNKSNIKLNTGSCLSFMDVTCKKINC